MGETYLQSTNVVKSQHPEFTKNTSNSNIANQLKKKGVGV